MTTETTPTLAEFIEARLAEDEATALAATAGPWYWDGGPGRDWGQQGPILRSRTVGDGTEDADVIVSYGYDACGINVSDGDKEHVARHDPARVLREVAAKREILAEHRQWVFGGVTGCSTCHAGHEVGDPPPGPCPTLRALAAVYSGHPDYRPEWAPVTAEGKQA